MSTRLRPWRRKPSAASRRSVGRAKERMAQQSARRDQENQGFPPCYPSTPRVIWTGSANSHTGQHRQGGASQAGQMAASDYVSAEPEFALALKGASTDGKRSFTTCP